MVRVLLLLFAMVLLGLPGGVAEAVVAEVASPTVDDCCPDAADGDDCCDEDFGRCCLPGMAALPPPAQARPSVQVVYTAQPVQLPAHLLLPRALGPPPTPPPIA